MFVEKSLHTGKFVQPMARCCVKVGIKQQEGQVFTVYTSHTKAGTLTLIDPSEKSLLAEKKDEHEEMATFGVIDST